MDLFLEICARAPTLVFSVMLLIAVGYWLIVMVGLAELDVLSGVGEGDLGEVGGMSGLLSKLGLDGLPLTLIFSGVALVGWTLSYFADLLLLQYFPFEDLRWVFSTSVVLGALLISLPITGLLLHPLKRLFQALKPVDSASLLGRSAVVRTPAVDETRGQAEVDDGGAGLILQVRAAPGLFQRGDRVVLVEYLASANAYRVIADQGSSPIGPT